MSPYYNCQQISFDECQLLLLLCVGWECRSLAEYILERENKKQQLAKVEAEIFRQRYQLEDWNGAIMSSLRPVSTHSYSSARNASAVGDAWDSKPIKVSNTESMHVVLYTTCLFCTFPAVVFSPISVSL